MTELAKIKPGHLRRIACVYLCQSSQTQVEFNRELTARQYVLVARAFGGRPLPQSCAPFFQSPSLGCPGHARSSRSGRRACGAEVILGWLLLAVLAEKSGAAHAVSITPLLPIRVAHLIARDLETRSPQCLWWVIDYNRQSLDSVISDRLFDKIEAMFRNVGWRMVALKYGRELEATFRRLGGAALRAWIDACPNALYSALVFKGGAA